MAAASIIMRKTHLLTRMRGMMSTSMTPTTSLMRTKRAAAFPSPIQPRTVERRVMAAACPSPIQPRAEARRAMVAACLSPIRLRTEERRVMAVVSKDSATTGTNTTVFSWAARLEPETWMMSSSVDSASTSPTVSMKTATSLVSR